RLPYSIGMPPATAWSVSVRNNSACVDCAGPGLSCCLTCRAGGGGSLVVDVVSRVAGRVDGYQRRHRWAGLPLAVVYKFADDQGGYLTALITYYGFVSLFPLLLLLVT